MKRIISWLHSSLVCLVCLVFLGLVFLSLVFLTLGGAQPALADAVLLADLVHEGSNLDSLDPSFGFERASLGDRVVFVAHDPQQGTELWGSDGTVAGTRILRDIRPGRWHSLPDALTVLGDRVVFVADDGVFGREIWSTDGTAAGTRLVRDGVPGPGSPFRLDLTASGSGGGRAVFGAFQDGGPALWQTDGTRAGTRRLPVGSLSGAGTIVSQIAVSDDGVGASRIYFRTQDDGSVPVAGAASELWTTDGTLAGTRRLVADCEACDLRLVDDDRLYFVRRTASGSEPWVSDGTPAGTQQLADACTGSCSGHPSDSFRWRDQVFFLAQAGSDPAERHLYRSDGTPEGTRRVVAGGVDSRGAIAHPVVLEDRLYFVSRHLEGPATLWTAPWNEAWSDPARDAPADAELVRGLESHLGFEMVAAESQLFFSYRSRITQKAEFWRSDGTDAGTYRLRRFDPDPQLTVFTLGATHLTPVGDGVIFRGHSSATGWEPWVSDGTSGGTRLLGDLDVDPGSLGDAFLTEFGERAAFQARTADGAFLGTTDGTPAGTDLAVPLAASRGSEMATLAAGPLGGSLVFSTPGGLWRSDGTLGGTAMISSEVTHAADFVALGDRLLFRGDGAYYNSEPWRTDGTEDGTEMVADLVPGFTGIILGCCANSSRPRRLTAAGDEVFFVADSAESEEDAELWRSDGTAAGTERVADLCPGLCSSDPAQLTATAEALFFSAWDGGHRRLWRLPLAAGPPRVLGAGFDVRAVAPLGQDGDGVAYFARRGGAPGHHLFVVGGAGDASHVVDLATPGGLPTFVQHAVAFGEGVVFLAANEAVGPELWITDGTAAGTRLVADLRPGSQGSHPHHLSRLGETLVFSADDGSGFEPWVFDGHGLRRLADVRPGAGSSLPSGFTRAGDRLVFEAWTPATGRELWSLPMPSVEPGDPAVLELVGGRFEVTVLWRNPRAAPGQPAAGQGVARTFSDNTGFFWFFGPDNLELAVKILDGTPINQHHWLLYGGLSDVEYTIHVRDRATGVEKTYRNEAGEICGDADVGAFPQALDVALDAALDAATSDDATSDAATSDAATSDATTSDAATSDAKSAHELLLQDGRFRVRVDWTNPHGGGGRGVGDAIPATDESGYFSFFDPGNVELIVKVLDGRPVNGKYWVFYGALTDLAYTIRVDDLETGAFRLYDNPPGEICGGADVEAF